MFRVPVNTVLPRVAAASLIALATGLSACGGGQSDPQGAASTTAGTSVAVAPASTPKLTKAQQAAQDKADAADLAKAKSAAEKVVSKNIPIVTDTEETAHTIKMSSKKKRSPTTLTQDIATAQAALEKAGQKSTKVKVTGGTASAAIQINNTTVVFFASDREAASSAQNFTLALAANPDYGRIARKDNRVYLVNTTQKISPADIAAFKSVRDVVDKAL